MKTELEKKYEELVIYLKALTISHTPDEGYENRLLAEIADLKQQGEKVTDEMIMDAAIKYKISIGSVKYSKEAMFDFIAGARAMRANLIK